MPTLSAVRRAFSRAARVPAGAQQPEPPAVDADGGQVEVVLHGQPGEQPRGLEGPGQAHPGALPGAQRRDVRAEQLDACPTVGVSAPAIRLNRVDLPAPFGPSTARRSPGRDVEVDVADGDDAAEAAGQPADRRTLVASSVDCLFEETGTGGGAGAGAGRRAAARRAGAGGPTSPDAAKQADDAAGGDAAR